MSSQAAQAYGDITTGTVYHFVDRHLQCCSRFPELRHWRFPSRYVELAMPVHTTTRAVNVHEHHLSPQNMAIIGGQYGSYRPVDVGNRGISQ